MGASASKTAPEQQNNISAAQKVVAEPRPAINSARLHKAEDRRDPNYVGSQREHPGRISQAGVMRQPVANAASRKRPLRHGDPELRLRVEGLNGFAAMLATMKEMGYDSDEDEEAAEQTTEVDVETGAAPTGVSSAAPTDVVVEGVGEERLVLPKQPVVGAPTRASHQSRFWVFAIIAVVIAACIAAVVVVLVVVVDDGNGNVPPSRLRRLALLRLT